MKSTKRNLPDESILEKLRKIARLAEMGYKGEAANARRVLEARLKEYGLTIEDVLTDRKTPKGGENGKELNKDDLERLRRALGLMRSIEANPYRKLLEQ